MAIAYSAGMPKCIALGCEPWPDRPFSQLLMLGRMVLRVMWPAQGHEAVRAAFILNLELLDHEDGAGSRRKSHEVSIQPAQLRFSRLGGAEPSPASVPLLLPLRLLQSWTTPVGVFIWLACTSAVTRSHVFFIPAQGSPHYLWALIWLKSWRLGEENTRPGVHEAIPLSWGELQ